MSIKHLLNKSVVIRRLRGSGYIKGYTATGTMDVHIQRIDQEDFQYYFSTYGATHKCWIDLNDDIQVGDRIIDPNENEYQVVAKDKKDFGTMVQHTELIIKKVS